MNVGERIGFSFVKAFGSSMIVIVAGIATQPTLRGVSALYVGAAIAALAAGISAVQVYVPSLTFRRWVKDPWGQMLDTFSHGFISAFLISVVGILHMQDLSTWKSAVTAALVGALGAGFRVAQNTVTVGAGPIPTKGLLPAEPRPLAPTAPPAPEAVSVAPVAPQTPPPLTQPPKT